MLGDVQSAGQFPYVEGMTVRTAIAIAGGFSARGYQVAADLTRIIDGEPLTGRVPLDTLLRPGNTVTVRSGSFELRLASPAWLVALASCLYAGALALFRS
ncbi:MAG: SLBB domain-containing protein [Methylocystis sp.]